MSKHVKHYVTSNIVDIEIQKSLEIVHLREIILDLIDAIDKEISRSDISRYEIFNAIQKARTSIQ